MGFAADIKKWCEVVEGDANEVVADTVEFIVRRIDQASPVGDPTKWKSPPPKGYVGGRFRANNQLSLGAPFAGTLDRIDADGRETVAANIARIPEDAAGNVFYVANNLPYARRLEYDHWSSQTAGAGIYGLVARDFQVAVEKAVAKVRGGR